MTNKLGNILNSFSSIDDFRIVKKCDHKLIDIIVIAIGAVISGANNWVAIHDFGVAKYEWFKKFLKLPNGIPSHDTFSRVFASLNPLEFERCFLNWINDVFEVSDSQIIPIDGKTLRKSYDKSSDKAAIHMVSAWGAANGIVLGQVKTDEKSNEITAIPKLLDLLDIYGSIITIDAMGCQKEIANKIIENGADYVIAVKENQPTLYNDVVNCIDDALELSHDKKSSIDYHETIDKAHGRHETRRYYAANISDDLSSYVEWPSINTVGMVESIRTANGKTTKNKRYYIASIDKDAKSLSSCVRTHWSVENCLHWVLDVGYKEDESRVRKGNGAENFSLLRRISLNFLKNEKTSKRSIQGKRNMCGWNERYLEKVVGF